MTRQDRYKYVLNYYRVKMPRVSTELEFGSAFQLIVSTLLSAQCTDKRVNQITPELFRHYPTAETMAAVEPEDVFPYIKSVSYPNAKAKHLIGMARMIVNDFGGELPNRMAVDTHVYRVSHRLGLVPKTADTPYKVEQELIKNIPEVDIPNAHHWLLLHGRYICTSRMPYCADCPFDSFCPKLFENSKLK